MSHLSTRARILLAWNDESEVLTRDQIMKRANTTDIHEFRHTVDADLIRPLQWKSNWPREYGLTPTGADRRQHFRDVENLIHG